MLNSHLAVNMILISRCRCKMEKIHVRAREKVTCIDLNIVNGFDTPLDYYYRNDPRKMQR